MNKKNIFICLIATLILSACSGPVHNFTPAEVPQLHRSIEAEISTVTVSIAKKEEAAGPIRIGYAGNLLRPSLKSALEATIRKAGAFQMHSDRKVALEARIMKFQTLGYGRSHDTSLCIHYDLKDTATGKSLLTRDIETTGQVLPTYSFNDATRYNEARNIAMRKNIVEFVAALDSYQQSQEQKPEHAHKIKPHKKARKAKHKHLKNKKH